MGTQALRDRTRDTAIGITLALAIVAGWLAVHIAGVFLIDWSVTPLWVGAVLVAVETWLFVGLFIVAHDCMHGSLAPGQPAVNRWVGRVVLFLYAAFSYDRLLPDHHRHHRRPGTADDPDFDPEHSSAFLPWFARFFRHYYGWGEFAAMGLVMTAYIALLRPDVPTLLVFYALPAILSAMQLFYFGTYRPHRIEDDAFADRHNARTDSFPPVLSLLTCFHFGYHHEHHVTPTTPWWRLPAAHRSMQQAGVVGRAKA